MDFLVDDFCVCSFSFFFLVPLYWEVFLNSVGGCGLGLDSACTGDLFNYFVILGVFLSVIAGCGMWVGGWWQLFRVCRLCSLLLVGRARVQLVLVFLVKFICVLCLLLTGVCPVSASNGFASLLCCLKLLESNSFIMSLYFLMLSGWRDNFWGGF